MSDDGAMGVAQKALRALAPLSSASMLANSFVAMGDSITAGSSDDKRLAGTSNTWRPTIYTMLIARSQGRLRAIQTDDGWPYTGAGSQSVAAALIARGGSGYSAGTYAAVDTSVGGSGATIALTIAGGVVTGATVTAGGSGYNYAPWVTVVDPAGTGSGAVVLAQPVSSGGGVYAAGGTTSIEQEAYLPLILNGGSPVARNVLLLTGTNNASRPAAVPLSVGLADTKASIQYICQTLVAGGVRPWVIATLPRNGNTGAQAKRQADALRRWMLTDLSRLVPGVTVLDASAWLVDATLGNEVVPTTLMPDGLHPGMIGADRIAKVLWAQMAPFFPAGAATIPSYGDGYNAIYNPTGNLLTPSSFSDLMGSGTATSPAAGEAPWTGTRQAGIYLSRMSGGTGTGTIAASTPARSDGKYGLMQQLAVNVTGAAQGETYRMLWSTGTSPTLTVGGANSVQVGDTLRAMIDEVILSNVTGLRGVKLKLLAGNASAGASPTGTNAMSNLVQATAWGDYEEAAGYPTTWNGDTFRLHTREMIVPPNTSYLMLVLEFVVNSGAASFTVQLSGASLRKVI